LVYLGNNKVMHQDGGVGTPGTWTYDGTTNEWTNEVVIAPATNHSHGIAETNMSENGGGAVVYFGGLIGNDSYTATWVYPRPFVDAIDVHKNEIPTAFHLKQNYPNPFNPITTIEYALPKAADVTISVYNIVGQKVATLINSKQAAGFYSIQWNGSDGFGAKVATGVYLYHIHAGNFNKTLKMVLMK